MKKKFEIVKSRLYAKADYTEIIEKKSFGDISLSYGELESLPMPTGAVCFFDAYAGGAVKPFSQTFAGEKCTPFYMCAPTSRGERIAFAGLKFSEKKAVEWKIALFEEKDVIKLISDDGGVSSYVDSGIVCLGDFSYFAEYDKLVKAHAAHDSHPLDGIVGFDGKTALVYEIGGAPALAVFSSGWGDGNYSCYIGHSDDGEAVSLVCDFGLLEYGDKQASDETVEYEFDVDAEELYVNDPKLSVDENNAAKWSLVLEYADKLDDYALYKAYGGRGFAYHRLGRLDDALKDYYAALEIAEDKTRNKGLKMREWTLYDNAGTINRNLGNTDEAIRLFEKAKNLGDSFYSGAYVNLIDIYGESKNYDKALEICDEMSEKRPLDPTSFMRRAEINATLGNYAAAVEDYDVLINKFLWEDGIWEKVSCLILLGRYDDAEKNLDDYLTENAANELYYYYSGLLEYKRADHVKSYEYLLRAHECNPEHIPTLHLLIETDDLFLDFGSVLKWAEEYTECRPTGAYGYHVRAEQNVRLGNFRTAAADREYIAEKFSGDALTYRGIACAYILAKDFRKAKKALKVLKKKDAAYYNDAFGLYCVAKGKFQKGERSLVAAAESGESETFFADLIDALVYMGKTDTAKKHLEKCRLTEQSSPRLVFSEIAYCRKVKDMNGLSEALDGYLKKFLPKLDNEELVNKIKNRLINYPLIAFSSK